MIGVTVGPKILKSFYVTTMTLEILIPQSVKNYAEQTPKDNFLMNLAMYAERLDQAYIRGHG